MCVWGKHVGFVAALAGEFWWLPSFAGGACQGRLVSVSCLGGHLLTSSLTMITNLRESQILSLEYDLDLTV